MNDSPEAGRVRPPLPEEIGNLAEAAVHAWTTGRLTPSEIFALVRQSYEMGLLNGQIEQLEQVLAVRHELL